MIPFLFALYFAGNVKLSQHLYPIAIMMLLMSLMAIYVARAREKVFLVTASATATMTVIAVWWIPYPLTLALAWEMLGVISLFAALFSLAPRCLPLEKRKGWYVPAFIAILSASLFAAILAGSLVWKGHCYPLFLFLILLEALALFIADEKTRAWIQYLSVGRALLVGLVWFAVQFVLMTGISSHVLWESIALFSVLALWNHFRVERDPDNVNLSGPMLPALAMVGGYLFIWVFVGALQMPPLALFCRLALSCGAGPSPIGFSKAGVALPSRRGFIGNRLGYFSR